MRDEMFGRMWEAHHQDFSADLARFFAAAGAAVSTALKRLHQAEFDSPWSRDTRGPSQA